MCNRTLAVCLALLLFTSVTPHAAAQDSKDLTKAFDAYNVVAKVGEVEKLLALRTAAVQKEIRGQIRKKEDREYFVLLSRAQVPESYEVQHVTWAKDGNSAELYMLWQLAAMKEMQRPRTRVEAMLTFKKESGAWKLDNVLPLAEPDKIKRPRDLTYNQKDADTKVTSASVAGRIVRIEFRPDHTLIMVRVMDEENAVFLPPKDVLVKANINFDNLAPWKMRVFTGYPHQSDKLKFFATGDNPME